MENYVVINKIKITKGKIYDIKTDDEDVINEVKFVDLLNKDAELIFHSQKGKRYDIKANEIIAIREKTYSMVKDEWRSVY